jgi:hypothetical protein
VDGRRKEHPDLLLVKHGCHSNETAVSSTPLHSQLNYTILSFLFTNPALLLILNPPAGISPPTRCLAASLAASQSSAHPQLRPTQQTWHMHLHVAWYSRSAERQRQQQQLAPS